jgi:hypothetical protein
MTFDLLIILSTSWKMWLSISWSPTSWSFHIWITTFQINIFWNANVLGTTVRNETDTKYLTNTPLFEIQVTMVQNIASNSHYIR